MPAKKKVKYAFAPNQQRCEQDSSNANSILFTANKIIQYLASRSDVEIVDDPNKADRFIVHAAYHALMRDYNILHIHGLYPTTIGNNWTKEHQGINKNILKAAQHSQCVIVPSMWVKRTIAREAGKNAVVAGWGIDINEWDYMNPSKDSPVLWNKTRVDALCNPAPMEYLSKAFSNRSFISTFGTPSRNMRIVGAMARPYMKELIQKAGVYMATTLETFGIGTIEAMASGVPILGYNWGGTSDIVRHMKDGYLAHPEDLDGIKLGYEWILDNYEQASKSARQRAMQYTWDAALKTLYELYKQADRPQYEYPVSVIVPSYNYQSVIGRCIDSIVDQSTEFEFEIIVVDDASSDNSVEYLHSRYGHMNNVTIVQNDSNIGTAETRNVGISMAKGEYIVCIDADDYMQDGLLQVLYNTSKHSTQVIAYTGITIEDEHGKPVPTKWLKSPFSWRKLENNQVPTCCMYPKRLWQLAGGYNQRYTPSEDAGLWIAMIMVDGVPMKVSEDGLFVHTRHSSNQSTNLRLKDWNDYHPSIKHKNYPHRLGSSVPPIGHLYTHHKPDITFVVVDNAPNDTRLMHLLDSIHAQSVRDWQCLVYSNASLHQDKYAWIEQYTANNPYTDCLDKIEAEYVVYLHTSDLLNTEFAEHCLTALHSTGKYVYSDYRRGDIIPSSLPYDRASILQGLIKGLNPIFAAPVQWIAEMPPFENLADVMVYFARTGKCGHNVNRVLCKTDYTLPNPTIALESIKMASQCCGYARKMAQQKKQEELSGEGMVQATYIKSVLSAPVYGSATGTHYGEFRRGDTIMLKTADYHSLLQSGAVQ